eukprot:scaffold15215_cov103-Isochrysis_galbana.AAC.11
MRSPPSTEWCSTRTCWPPSVPRATAAAPGSGRATGAPSPPDETDHHQGQHQVDEHGCDLDGCRMAGPDVSGPGGDAVGHLRTGRRKRRAGAIRRDGVDGKT